MFRILWTNLKVSYLRDVPKRIHLMESGLFHTLFGTVGSYLCTFACSLNLLRKGIHFISLFVQCQFMMIPRVHFAFRALALLCSSSITTALTLARPLHLDTATMGICDCSENLTSYDGKEAHQNIPSKGWYLRNRLQRRISVAKMRGGSRGRMPVITLFKIVILQLSVHRQKLNRYMASRSLSYKLFRATLGSF